MESLATNRVINTQTSLSFNVRRDSPVSFLSIRVNSSCIYIRIASSLFRLNVNGATIETFVFQANKG